MPPTLRVGDTVLWRGSHGNGVPMPANVVGFFSELVDPLSERFDEYGAATAIPWDYMTESAYRGVYLANDMWAYGYQIAPVEG